uniref:Uncharacterized protein n=1 Tax=Glossina pallidipes TaxID=7398 RepID=A0A1A9ZKX7_GLOPL
MLPAESIGDFNDAINSMLWSAEYLLELKENSNGLSINCSEENKIVSISDKEKFFSTDKLDLPIPYITMRYRQVVVAFVKASIKRSATYDKNVALSVLGITIGHRHLVFTTDYGWLGRLIEPLSIHKTLEPDPPKNDGVTIIDYNELNENHLEQFQYDPYTGRAVNMAINITADVLTNMLMKLNRKNVGLDIIAAFDLFLMFSDIFQMKHVSERENNPDVYSLEEVNSMRDNVILEQESVEEALIMLRLGHYEDIVESLINDNC